MKGGVQLSNFTIGILILNENRDVFKRLIKRNNLPWDLDQINQRWSLVETEDQFVIEEPTLKKIAEFSKELPFLYFLDAEDHEWGFTIFNDGRELATFYVPHGDIVDSAINIENISLKFKVFDISDELINKVTRIILNTNEAFENTWQQVEEFKKAIGIEEFY